MTRRLLLLAAFIVVAAALLFIPLPDPGSYAGRTLENAGHMPLFFFGTLFVLAIIRNDFRVDGVKLYVYAGLIGMGAGILSEAIQKPLRRDASWEDVFADAIGVLLALAIYALFDRRSRIHGAARAAAVLIAAGCVVLYLIPMVNMVRAYMHRDGQFPVLASFDSNVELFWIVPYGIKTEVQDGALDVEFIADQFPGFTFHEPAPDWRNYQTLVIDVENPESVKLYLGMRIHDIGHGRVYTDRFNRRFEVEPGEHRALRIPLQDVRQGPRNRLMNMAQISDVTLFRQHDSPSQHLRLYSIRLE